MTVELEPTGERLIEDHYRESLGGYVIYLMHAASYRFAENYCRNKHVLDLGCGSGYGAARISEVAATVHAVDISEEAIAYARNHYSRSNVSFGRIDPDARLPFVDSNFDVVLSFQVIEHVQDDRRYLHEASRVLRRDGTLILITPDRANRLLPWQRPWNRWHVREYSAMQLRALVEHDFEIRTELSMGARSDVAEVELRRYRRLKWLTLPFTLPILPDALRRTALDALHRLQAAPTTEGLSREPDFNEEVIEFASHVPASLNLVMVATPRRAA